MKAIRAPLATAPPSTWINTMSTYWGVPIINRAIWTAAWIGYAASGRIDEFVQGESGDQGIFVQRRSGQPGDRVKALFALPALQGFWAPPPGDGPRCMALVESGSNPTKQTLLFWNGARWVLKVGACVNWQRAGAAARTYACKGGAGIPVGLNCSGAGEAHIGQR